MRLAMCGHSAALKVYYVMTCVCVCQVRAPRVLTTEGWWWNAAVWLKLLWCHCPSWKTSCRSNCVFFRRCRSCPAHQVTSLPVYLRPRVLSPARFQNIWVEHVVLLCLQKWTVISCWKLRPLRRSVTIWVNTTRQDRFCSAPQRSCGIFWRMDLKRRSPLSSVTRTA